MKIKSLALASVLTLATTLPLIAFAQDDSSSNSNSTSTTISATAEAQNLRSKLTQLDGDSRFSGIGMYERTQALQAVNALQNASRSDRATLSNVANARVQIAQTVTKTQLLESEITQMDREISDLNLEITRRENQRMGAENERLRIEAVNREEEAKKLREQAAAAQQVMQQYEAQETATATAARQKDLKLAREEAELESGAKLPPSKFEDRGEVFNMGGDTFASATNAVLSAKGSSSIKALAQYLKVTSGGAISVQVFSDNQGDVAKIQGLTQERADAIVVALKKAGVTPARLTGKGMGSASPVGDNTTAAGRWKNRRAEILIASPPLSATPVPAK